MGKCKELYTDIMDLYFDEGLAPVEIADKLNVPVSLVIDIVSMSPLACEPLKDENAEKTE